MTASVTRVTSKTMKVSISNPEKLPITDMVADLLSFITGGVADIPNGLLGLGWGSGSNEKLHVCNR